MKRWLAFYAAAFLAAMYLLLTASYAIADNHLLTAIYGACAALWSCNAWMQWRMARDYR